MNEWRRSRFGNPATWLTVIGSGVLAFTLTIPWLSAARTTRVENRADGVASALLEASEGFSAPLSETDTQCLLARFYLVAACREVRTNEVERIESPSGDVLLSLTNKHYAFQLTQSPIDATARATSKAVAALEVLAWPLSSVGPGHCVFFYPEDASRSYSRNLRASYAGLADETRPAPGAAHRRPGLGSLKRSQYPGNDNERWIIY